MAVEDITTKRCTKCGVNKHLTEFNKSSSTKDGFRHECRRCAAAYYEANKDKLKASMAAWRLANRDRSKAIIAAWHAANPEKRKEYWAKYYAANRDALLERSAAYYAANKARNNDLTARWRAENPDKCKELAAKWNKENPELRCVYQQNRRALKRANGGRLSKGLAERLFKRQKGKCACCGLPLGDDYHLDHIMPLALGGSNTDGNMQLLRARCNVQKSAKHPVDFMRQRGFLL